MGKVDVSVDASVATIVIDNEGRYNAITRSMLEGLIDAVVSVDGDPVVRAVVFRGAAGHFSAGLNIGELGVVDDESSLQRKFVELEDRVAALGRPTIAAIDGFCLGGGMQLALACDLRVAAHDARLAITPAKLGVIYPASSVERIVRAVGSAWARYLLLSADHVSAEQALGMGLVQRVVEAADFDGFVAGFAERLTGHSAVTMLAAKQMIAGAAEGHIPSDVIDFWTGIDNEDLARGLTAFHQGERPDFGADSWPMSSQHEETT